MKREIVIALLLVGTAIANERVITFKNYCSKPVWFGFAGGSSRNRHSPTDTSCGSDGDCYTGTSCVQTGNIKQCFWNNPEPANGNYELGYGESNEVRIPVTGEDYNIIWSGAVSGRTNCNDNNCETADCGNGGKKCKSSQGFQQPATQAEFTFQKRDQDYYDIEIINGVHMPISMGPTNAAASSTYQCGNPGSKHPKTNHGACNWQFNPPSNDYQWVTMGGNHCNSNSDCSSGTCGISFNPGHADLLQKTCGDLLGYWTADQICGITPSYGAPFNCQDRTPEGVTLWNLYACVGVGSCYQQGAASNCCGCSNWEEEGVPVPAYPDTEKCKNKNPTWQSRVKDTLLWLKKACPSAYTYPFDDMSSTFMCKNDVGGVNIVNYEIVFCPNNETGNSHYSFLE